MRSEFNMVRNVAPLLLVSLIGCASAPVAVVRAPIGGVQVPAKVDVAQGALAAELNALFVEAAKSGFGGAVIVEQGGQVVLKGGYGFADRERSIPYTAQTVHDVGSISKPFTAAAILQLVRGGKLDLAKPVKSYLPEAAEPAASVTLHQLLTHSSGMAPYCRSDDDRVTKRELLTYCMARPLRAGAGKAWQYSNPGYSVLAAIVERVSQQPLDTYLKRRIFQPLGMTMTGYVLPQISEAQRAKSYSNDRLMKSTPGRAADGQHWQVFGNGGVQSTAEDMYRWHQALSGKLPLDPGIAEMMKSRQVTRTARAFATYGGTLTTDDSGDPNYWGHDGSDGYFYASFISRPKDRTFMYLVGNNGEDRVVAVLRQARTILARHGGGATAAPRMDS
jgi:CubicO group peptidase (beta-lactamase class C family)